jgi:hypothetical protein
MAATLASWPGYGGTDIVVNTTFATPTERLRTWQLLGSLR